jgi:hypothetical protein
LAFFLLFDDATDFGSKANPHREAGVESYLGIEFLFSYSLCSTAQKISARAGYNRREPSHADGHLHLHVYSFDAAAPKSRSHARIGCRCRRGEMPATINSAVRIAPIAPVIQSRASIAALRDAGASTKILAQKQAVGL